MLHEEGTLSNLPERPPTPEIGKQLGFGVGEAKELARLPELVARLRVDDLGLGVGEQPFREAVLAASFGTCCPKVGEPVQDHDILSAEGAGELERLLEPLADAEAGEDAPALVDDDDSLRPARVGLGFDHRLQPRRGAGHQDPERGGMRVEDSPEVEDDERRVEVEAGRGRTVKHAAQVAGAELVERERHWPHGVRNVEHVHRERLSHLGAGVHEDVDDGRIWFDGTEITDPRLDLRPFKRRIGMVFQAYNLFPHMSVIDNVVLAPVRVHGLRRAEAEEHGRALLDRFGVGDLADAHPDRLSGGQQQRVALARALATGPDLLLLDEVTSALDPELVGEMLEMLRELARDGMTMVLATHEMGFARDVATKVCFLDDGTVLEQGPPEQVLVDPREERTRRFLRRVLA